MNWLKCITAAALTATTGMALAAPCTVTSPAHRVALVELFTSEGCSSCPPADAWLRRLPAEGYGPDRVVPLALHVDYWDYIGWKDRFASARYSERQRAYSAIGNSRFVYTPQVVFDGRDFRGWSSAGAFEQAVRAANATPARAAITVSLDEKERGYSQLRVGAELPKDADHSSVSLYVVAYANGQSTQVKAFDTHGRAQLVERIAHSSPGGVAAFVQAPRTGEVLQATSLAYCRAD